MKIIQYYFILTYVLGILFINAQSLDRYPDNKIFMGNSKCNVVSGKYIFISAGGKILIREILSADSVYNISELTLPSIITDLKVQGSYLFVADLMNGLFIYDYSNILSPKYIGSYKSPYRAYGIFVNGNDLYVSWGKDGLSKIDVTLKENPVQVKYSSIKSDKIQLYYGNLYCQTKYTLSVLNPNTLDSIITFPSGNAYPRYEIKNIVYNDFTVAVIENYYGILESTLSDANIASDWASISFYDVTNITNPKLKKILYNNSVQSAEAVGNILYCVTLDSLIKYKIYENTFVNQTPINLSNRITNMTMNDSLLFMNTDYPGCFQIARHSNQNSIVTNYLLDTKADIGSIAATDSFIIAGTNAYGGLYYIDIKSSTKPIIKHKFNNNIGFVRGLKIIRDTVYAATEKGLKIFAIKNDSLSLIGDLYYGEKASNIDVKGNIVAIGGFYDVHLIDILNRNNPKYLTKFKYQYSQVNEDVLIRDSILFFTNSSYGISCYNIANPSLPESLWWRYLNGDGKLCLKDNNLFVGGGNTIEVFNISNIKIPIHMDSLKLPNNYQTKKIAVRDSLLFVSFYYLYGYYETNGLLVYQIAHNGKLTLNSITYTPGIPNSLALNSKNIFMCFNLDGIYQYNISSLLTFVSNPSFVNTPLTFELNQNYPNPFNPSTIIEFNINRRSYVELRIYDVLGREISELINEEMYAGKYRKIFEASKLSTGVYYYKLSVDGYNQVKKMLLIK